MKTHLKIDLAALPEEGKLMTGELPGEVFDLPEGDARAVGPLEYDLRAQRFGSELLLTGSLSAPFEFTCVRTLHPFIQTIRLDDAAISVEIGKRGRGGRLGGAARGDPDPFPGGPALRGWGCAAEVRNRSPIFISGQTRGG
jgi:hypothetical protein